MSGSRIRPVLLAILGAAVVSSACSLIVDIGNVSQGDAEVGDIDGDVRPPDAADADADTHTDGDVDVDAEDDLPGADGDADADGDGDADADTHADGDVDGDAEDDLPGADGDADADGDGDTEADEEGEDEGDAVDDGDDGTDASTHYVRGTVYRGDVAPWAASPPFYAPTFSDETSYAPSAGGLTVNDNQTGYYCSFYRTDALHPDADAVAFADVTLNAADGTNDAFNLDLFDGVKRVRLQVYGDHAMLAGASHTVATTGRHTWLLVKHGNTTADAVMDGTTVLSANYADFEDLGASWMAGAEEEGISTSYAGVSNFIVHKFMYAIDTAELPADGEVVAAGYPPEPDAAFTLTPTGAIVTWPAYLEVNVGEYESTEVHRGAAEGFTPGPVTLLGTVTDVATHSFADTTGSPSTTYYYKLVTRSAGHPTHVSGEIHGTTPATGQFVRVIQGRDASASTFVRQIDAGDVNFYGSLFYYIAASGWNTRPMIRFDPLGIPATAVVDSVSFHIHQEWVSFGSGGTMELRSLSKEWSAREVTWNSAGPGRPWAIPGTGTGDYVATDGSLSFTNDLTFFSTTLSTSTIQGWVSGSISNFGWILFGISGGDRGFASAECRHADMSAYGCYYADYDPNYAPRLDATYHMP